MRSPAAPGSIVVVSLGFDTYGLDPIGDFALTTEVYHEVGRRVAAARSPAGHPAGGRLPPPLARGERAGLVAWRRGPPVRPIAVHRVHRARDGRLIRGARPDDARTSGRGARAAGRRPGRHRRAVRPAAPMGSTSRVRDARPHRARAAGIAGLGSRRIRSPGRGDRSVDPASVPAPDRRGAAGHRVQPPEGALRPGAGDARSSTARSIWMVSLRSTTTARSDSLEAIPGIGRWTSTIYLLMVLGRPDVWPVGDIALATAVAQAKGLPHGRARTSWRSSARRGGHGGPSPRGCSGTTIWRVGAPLPDGPCVDDTSS